MRSFKITEGVQAILADLSRDATDIIGREISQSAVLRGLLRWAERQGGRWVQEQITPLIEEELGGGTTWGRKG